MAFIRMTYIVFIMIILLMIHKSVGKENCTSVKQVKTRLFLKLAEEMIAKARENIPSDSKDKQPNIIKKARDCKELQQLGNSNSGVYTIWLRTQVFGEKRLNVYCDMETDGGGWTVIQRRGNYSTPIDFYRDWSTYKEGFGEIHGEFWFGNDNIYDMTKQQKCSVRFDLKANTGERAYAQYGSFWIEGEYQNYRIHIKNYSGNAGDAMKYHDGQKFSTKDKDNDISSSMHCAQLYHGAWWYKDCYQANLNGLMGFDKGDKVARWNLFKNEKNSLNHIEIKIRPNSERELIN